MIHDEYMEPATQRANDRHGIYVHVPICRSRCLYCDFYSELARHADRPRYVDALLNEARNRCKPAAATLYIGGGTPSLLPPDLFRRMADGLKPFLANPLDEFTIEVNPDDVTEEMCRIWHDCGVDRVSMGVQSMVDSELKSVGRRHTSHTASTAFEILRRFFNNISLDVIFGLPGQTPDSLDHTISELLAMRPQHVSAYSLMYEERSALTRMRDSGRIQETDEADCVVMFRHLSRRLARAGYEQYEISNYALPGYRSRHNSSYWQGLPYVGLGPGAHSYDGRNTRMANHPDLRRYIDFWTSPSPLRTEEIMETESLSIEELREEMIMTRLRTREGLDLRDFRNRFGADALKSLVDRARPHLSQNMLRISGHSLALTPDGIMVSDEIMSDLF